MAFLERLDVLLVVQLAQAYTLVAYIIVLSVERTLRAM